jgi:hypothetical protein
MARLPIGTPAQTGQRCLESGVWRVAGIPATALIERGNVMPRYVGTEVIWILIRYA